MDRDVGASIRSPRNGRLIREPRMLRHCTDLGAEQVFGRYAMGWWPSKLIVILNIIVLLGYAVIVCIVGGQILSAVSPHGSMSVVVGIIIVALITWVITTFGISIVHYYERFAFLPQAIVLSILFGVAAKNFDLTTQSVGNAATTAGNRLSFFSICLSAGITYAGLAGDYFVYWPARTSRPFIFFATLVGLSLSFTFTLVVGVGLASGITTYQPYSNAWNNSQGGSGSGALLVAGLEPLGAFGKFCAVVVALGGVANTIPPTYSSGIDFQILGRQFERIPRVVWNTVGVIIFTVCALAGRNSLAIIFTNFLALMGYWVAIWIAIMAEECLFFRRGSQGYNWVVWDKSEKLPRGIAAIVAFLIGWAGAILCMAQVWYIGPIARLVGEYGADMGNYVGFCWAALVYPLLRWWELRRFGR
jgi:purine-cytosine permease-like protein